ncbi:MAG: rhodanese-like domain-containing protein, partial [Terriglobia bacterium]
DLARAGVQAASSPPASSPASNKTQAAPPPASSAPSSPSAAASGLGAGNPFGGGALAGVQGTASLACSPNEAQLEQPTLIGTPEAKALFEGNPKPLFVDVREPDAFAAGHIQGAINIPVEDITQKWSSLPKDKVLVFYEAGDRGGTPNDVCAFSRAAGRVMLAHGYDKARVKVYQDGLKGWQQAGLPVSH